MNPLLAAFQAARSTSGRAPPERLLQRCVDEAVGAHPHLDPTRVVHHLAQQQAICGDPDVLGRVHAADIGLAVAALDGDPAALRAFEANAIAPAYAAAARICGDLVDDALQDVRDTLLTGLTPKLQLYSGLGPLKGWVRVCAVRTAMRRKRRQPKEVPFSAELVDQIDASAPSGSIRAGLEIAVREAFADLPARQRAILQMYYRDGAELAELGKVYGVHLSTVSRWLAQARQAVYDGAYAVVERELRLSRTEAGALLGFAVEIDASMGSLLALSEVRRR